ncbi:Variable outer membrane protein (plasmid) [Borrelia crocidurae DOU]|uniref:Variable large protein n=1 Tax=Borrelia crocidurae DOU TaxID=1293575 RepID=W5SJM3_9SPIR|nr:Variable outer membrane protein [Borrelia crocidurae DOU]
MLLLGEDMVGGTLGIKAETKKNEIGGYFSKITETMKEVREDFRREWEI